MNNRAIASLINRISKGTISENGAYRKLDSLDKKYGPFEMLYDVSNRTDAEYFEELLSDFRLGVYSKESIQKMIEIKAKEKKLPFLSYSTLFAIVGSVLLVLIFVITLVIWRK